jgi:formylglycine-generating enzyme required for sulfatase activity
MDKYDVTVGRFRRFVAAWNNGNGYIPLPGWGKHSHLNGGLGLVNSTGLADGGTAYENGWDLAYPIAPTNANLTSCTAGFTWTNAPGSQENLPITCINWYEAYAFCIWDGGFLPSEAEWEYAAHQRSRELRAGGHGETGDGPLGSAAPGR